MSKYRGAPGGIKVWDIGIRAFHWLLVLAVLVAALTGFLGARNDLFLHLVGGIGVAGLIGFRLLWGLLGKGYARFSSFAFRPAVVLDHARGLRRGGNARYLGHNPLGGVMVFALLAVLLLIVVTGVVVLGGQLKQGPLAADISFALGSLTRNAHKLLSLLLLAMVAAHLAGVAFESWHGRENLALAMVNGRKRPEPGVMPPATSGHPIAVASLLLAGGLAAAGLVWVLAARPGLGVPPAKLDARYAAECGACHIPYHPSLAPTATWLGILGTLENHFGEDASLDPATLARITAYLTANAAEHWDTLPAVRLRAHADPTAKLRITATDFWRRMHRRIPEAVFADHRVGGRGNCLACHGDAETGLFAPQSIEIPEDLQ